MLNLEKKTIKYEVLKGIKIKELREMNRDVFFPFNIKEENPWHLRNYPTINRIKLFLFCS